ncbi:MAG TPA: alpha-amylase family glycosyl hydrolase [Acidobacteriaceae bacterium]
MPTGIRRLACCALASVFLLPGHGSAASPAPAIDSIDPPGWWAEMPAPLLLVHGQHLEGSRFSLSDSSLHIRAAHISENGHWATLQLAASPARAVTIRVSARNQDGAATAEFTFKKRREATDGLAGFGPQDVLYLIMTDRFADGDLSNDGDPTEHTAQLALPRGWHGGDLRGISQHLDYLEALGVTAVWITPVYENKGAQSYHGYGATNLYAVDPHYGALEDLQALAAELHRRHMKLVLDTVPNHIGPAHPWVDDEPEPDWFHGTRAKHRRAQGEFAPLVNPHQPWRDQQDILEGWFADTLPDMNQENPDVAQYLTQNAIWWIEQTGADGLRIDTFPYVGRPFWHSFHAQLGALYPRITTVGEIFNRNPVITSAFAGGVLRNDLHGDVDTGLTTPFDFPTYFAIRDVLLHDKPMRLLAEVLEQDALYPHPERLVPFLGNHDTKRFLSEEGATPDKLQLAFALLLTMRGMPQLYSGDEIAMSGGDDPENRHDFPGGFGGSRGAAGNAFTPAGRTPAEQQMYGWVQRLLTLRRQYPELQEGDEQVLHADRDTLLYARGSNLGAGCAPGQGRMLVAINKSAESRTVSFKTGDTALAGCKAAEAILGSAILGSLTPTAEDQISLPPGASLLYWK